MRSFFKSGFDSLRSRYPAVARWVSGRLSAKQFKGLPLTVLTGLLLVNGLVLSEVAENIVNTEPMVQVDAHFTTWLFQGRTSRLSRFLYAMTWFGSQYATVGLALMGSVVLLWQRKRRYVGILWLLLGGVAGLVQLGKRTFDRARPLEVAYYPETGYSFPSGHSATAMTLYGLLAYWWIRRLPTHLLQVVVGLGATGLILVVGFSRIYLGVHFLSDVLGGYLLGSSWLIVGIVLTEWQRSHSTNSLD